MAKLLSKNEQVNSSEKLVYAQIKPPFSAVRALSGNVFLVLLIVFAFRLLLSGGSDHGKNPSLQLRLGLLEMSFGRPPPALS
jgi:hypothetical protein